MSPCTSNAGSRSSGVTRYPTCHLRPEARLRDVFITERVHPKIVSEMLGHSSISITLDTYSHVLPTMQENAVHALEDALG